MNKKKKDATQVAITLSVCGLITWHTIHWHSTGMYLEMLDWLRIGRGYITVLYNLGLMLILGVTLDSLTGSITDLVGYKENVK